MYEGSSIAEFLLAEQKKITISGNVMIDDSTILLINTRDSSITGNVSTGSLFNGIQLAGGNSRVTIKGNVLRDGGDGNEASGGGGFTGINLTGNSNFGNASSPDTRITIQGNVVTGFSASGIRLRGDTNNSIVKGNVVLNNGTSEGDFGDGFGNGITLESGSFNNRVESNTIKGNFKNGIFVDSSAEDNLIQSNFSLDNGELDYRDDSEGDGTAGTANKYKRNKGRFDSPDGLIQYEIR